MQPSTKTKLSVVMMFALFAGCAGEESLDEPLEDTQQEIRNAKLASAFPEAS
jgi:hypothetical protein